MMIDTEFEAICQRWRDRDRDPVGTCRFPEDDIHALIAIIERMMSANKRQIEILQGIVHKGGCR
jgi:hypothetical protein